MNFALLNMNYDSRQTTGGSAHVRQFVNHLLETQHTIWSFGGIQEEGTRVFSTNLFERNLQFRYIDIFYHRMEGLCPRSLETCLRLRNCVARNKPHVVEWNTIPEFRQLMGDSPKQVERECEKFRRNSGDIRLNICVSDLIADRIARLGMTNCVVVPNGSEPEHFSTDVSPCPRMEACRNYFNVVMLGSMDLNWHNFSYLRQIATRVQEHVGDSVLFHLIGPGLKDCHEMPMNVIYHGSVSYQRLPEWLVAMDLGVIIYEGEIPAHSSPLKLFDYMASGLSVLSTPQPQVRTILQEAGVSNGVMNSMDPQEMAAAILEQFRDSQLCRANGAKLRRLLAKKYTWSRNVEVITKEVLKVTQEG